MTDKLKNKSENKSENISWFKDIKKDDIPYVGGKGANLGEMFEIMPIPNGFCVTVSAYDMFLERTQIKGQIFSLLSSLNIADNKELDAISEKIRQLIKKQLVPDEIKNNITINYNKLNNKFVAVRSSGTAEDLPTASFAGQQDTYLNISGEDRVINAVKDCWASLFTSRAIYYRHTNKFKHEDVKISIVIQEMINSEKAGVIFTVNPVNNNKNEMIIEGSWGLGESVVSGQITPDTYTIKRSPFQILDINIGTKATTITRGRDGNNITLGVSPEKKEMQLLNESELKRLTELAIKIEQHYKFPQDIEWAIEGENFFILQSRPITTLNK